jgi:hypothetical protein
MRISGNGKAEMKRGRLSPAPPLRPCRSSKEAKLPLEKFLVSGSVPTEERNSLSVWQCRQRRAAV